jgi:hypothetical protein
MHFVLLLRVLQLLSAVASCDDPLMQKRLAAPVANPNAIVAPSELTAFVVAAVTIKIAAFGVPIPATVKS